MTPFLWILIFVQSSLQVCDESEQTEVNTVQPYDGEPYVLQYQSTCQKTTLCTICAKKVFISSILTCSNHSTLEEVCTYQSVPQIWKTECNLINLYDSLPYWQNDTFESTYWYPAKRNVPYGPYEFAVFGGSYGISVADRVNISLANVENIFTKDCLIKDARTGVIVPEYCNAKHVRNCSVSKTEQTEFCSSSCAYCSDSYVCFTGKSFCTNAEVFSSNEYFPDTDTECSRSLKKPNNCLNRVNLVLSFTRQLYLIVYSPECIYEQGDPDYVYCFTDASERLKKRVSLKVVFNSTAHPQNEQNNFIVYQLELEEYVGQYWCTAGDSIEELREYQSNTVLAYKTVNGNEFAIRLKINDVCSHTDCSDISEINFLIGDVKGPIERIGFGKVRLMGVNAFYNGSFADIIIHVSTLHERPGMLADFYKLSGILKRYPDYINVLYCRSSERCLPDSNLNLTWPFARQFQTVLPSELCVKPDGSPFTRFCEGDFLFGLNWRPVYGECSEEHVFNEDTLRLQSFLNKTVSENLIQNLSDIVYNGNLTLIDLYFVSQILERSTEHTINSTFLNASLSVVNGLLKKDFNLLLQAQEILNITDSYLRTSETIAVNLSDSDFNNVLTLQKENVIFHSFNPIMQNASGFVLYKNYSIKHIPLMGSFEDIEDVENTKLALYVPVDDIQSIVANSLMNVSIVAVIYLNDHLFPSNINSTAELVINLNIPNYDDYLQSPIPLLINSDLDANFNCSFWDYGDLRQQKRGNWSSVGSSHEGQFNNHTTLQVCSYSHLTHLALLVVAKKNDSSVEGTNNSILTVITALGSLLSLLGILGIFLTSCLFRSWRDKAGTQILLHLSVATSFEIVFMYLNGIKMFNCSVAGSILQYVVISKFAWMLVYAYCQYLRFVRVFGPMPNRLVLKSAIFGWGLGIMPTAAVLLTDPDTYYQERFCYPNGNHLFLGVYLPVGIILIINCFIFCKIMCEVTKSRLNKTNSSKLKTQHVKLAVLLFSVLGIPWCFGLISNILPFVWLKTIFLYIFTITSVLQGSLMFLFYVIFNKETRESWKRFLCQQRKTYEMFSSKKSNSISSIS